MRTAARLAELRYDLKLDLPGTGAAAGWLLVSELAKSGLTAASCRWCALNGFDRSARSALRWRDTQLIAEAVFVSQSLNQVVNFSTGRERPFVHALSEVDKLHTAHPNDNNTAFYSGHTNVTFSLAVAAGTVASMRRYRWAT